MATPADGERKLNRYRADINLSEEELEKLINKLEAGVRRINLELKNDSDSLTETNVKLKGLYERKIIEFKKLARGL